MFCGNMDKFKAFKEKCIKYGVMFALLIPEYCDSKAAHAANKWGGPEMGK